MDWLNAPPGADAWRGYEHEQGVRASGRLVTPPVIAPPFCARVGTLEQAREDRRGDSVAVDLVRPAHDALSQLFHFGQPTIRRRERLIGARSAVHRREPDPSSGLASRIGIPAPSYEPHRPRADNGRWGRHRMSRRGARGVAPVSRANTTIRFAAEYSGWQADRIRRS